ncbi:MAG: hypothetical protein JJ975_12415 [Bacteroidia bacterium]|nr:hypothetical protein [Bacteroidia bacterium]
MILTITDQSVTGNILKEIELMIDRERINLKDLISKRVEWQVLHAPADSPSEFRLFDVAQKEETLNPPRKKTPKKPNVERHIATALKAFRDNEFFVFVDNRQIESLEEEVLLTEETPVSFVQLTQLVGG